MISSGVRQSERGGLKRRVYLYGMIYFYLILSPCLICRKSINFLREEKDNFTVSHKISDAEGNRDITEFKCLNLKMKVLMPKDLKLLRKDIFLVP